MGRVRVSRRRCSKNKEFKKHHDTKRRRRDIDQIQDDLTKEKVTGEAFVFEVDDDLPGMGQFYCTECARHFHDNSTLEVHRKTKVDQIAMDSLRLPSHTQHTHTQKNYPSLFCANCNSNFTNFIRKLSQLSFFSPFFSYFSITIGP